MADRSILYRLRAALQGGYVAVANEVQVLATHVGVLSGAVNVETALSRIDGTGIGSPIFQFTGAYSAQASNIDEWFGGRQQVRLRCIDSGTSTAVSGSVRFDLPGGTALGTAFDQLVAAGLPEQIQFFIEYTGPSDDFLQIFPRVGAGNPQLIGTSSIIVRSGVAATIEVTRTSGTISDYTFVAIGGIGQGATLSSDAIKLISPSDQTWDASATGTLPDSSSVIKGNAYKVVNAPSDGSGRFGEVMQNDDWVVWNAVTFTTWTQTANWFVIPAHEVRRITALEQDFLTDVQESPVSSRNTVTRGANYADTAGELRLKMYATEAGYSALDLNTTGDIDEFTDPADQSGVLAVRLDSTMQNLGDTLATLYAYVDDGNNNFTLLGNLERDFAFQGDFGSESDYLLPGVNYTANEVIRIYRGELIERFNHPSLDVDESNLSDELQAKVNRSAPWESVAEVLFSGATVSDVHATDRIEYDAGYSRGIDWRDMAESTTINDSRYIDSDLAISVNLAAFTVTGFGSGLQKVIGIKLQRNDANNGTGAMIEIGPSVAFIRVNTSNEIEVNTTPGSGTPTWSTFSDGASNATLGAGSNNFFLFELVPEESSIAGEWEIIADFFDGTNYHELNNVTFTPSGVVSGDQLGFSRSANQRGQVTEFKAIKSPGYLTHSQLDTLLRQHVDDKWAFGFARLYESGNNKEVILQTSLSAPVVQGSGAPVVTPDFIGQYYIDTAAKGVYFAIGVSNSGDWELLN